MSPEQSNRFIKRVPLTIGLLLISGLGFTASLDFNALTSSWLLRHASGNSDHAPALALMCGGSLIYFVVGTIAVIAIWLIWIGIREWPLRPN